MRLRKCVSNNFKQTNSRKSDLDRTQDTGDQAIANSAKDRFSWLKEILFLLYIKCIKFFTKRRFDLYDADSKDPFVFGALPSPKERQWELPQKEKPAKDEIFIYGTNSKGECLMVRIARSNYERAEAWVLLRLTNGKCYTLQKCGKTIDDQSFNAAGLKIECLSPMRRWRIFFNGMLRDDDCSTSGEEIYVRFSFVWIPMSDVFDLTDDISPSFLATAFSNETWSMAAVRRLNEIFDCYEQGGYIEGTVTLEKEESELHLWGTRRRTIGKHYQDIKDGQFQHVYSFLPDGTLLSLGCITLPGVVKNLNYGYVVHSNGHLHSVSRFDESDDCQQGHKIGFEVGKKRYQFSVDKGHSNVAYDSNIGWSGCIHTSCVNVTLNENTGCGLSLNGSFRATIDEVPQVSTTLKVSTDNADFVLPINDPRCQNTNISGGKGSSLAKLYSLSLEDCSFSVPGGVIVTTTAYKKVSKQKTIVDAINSLENVAWKRKDGDLGEECERTTSVFASLALPNDIENAITSSLKKYYANGLDNIRFAVRSSSKGEDGQDLSAAGQMETYLGVKGINEILSCVKKCWASQFRYIAVQYKRQNGQLLNSEMAVVIQEMASCEKAGVMFTCDSFTGNPSYITITANYGLGETVVSSKVEPDCVMLKRSAGNDLNIHSTTLGQKSTQIVIDETKGTIEKDVTPDNASRCCLSEDQAIALGKIGMKIEAKLGFICDIEWGVIGENFVLLQARPVTSIDAVSNFEIVHERDSCLRSEDEYSTSANIGEVLPGALSTLGLCTLANMFEHALQGKSWRKREVNELSKSPYFVKGVVHACNHAFINVVDTLFRANSEEGVSEIMKGTMISVFGRILDDDDLFRKAFLRHSPSSKIDRLRSSLYFLNDILFSARALKKIAKKYANYKIPVENFDTAKSLYDALPFEWWKVHPIICIHYSCTFASSSYNLAVLRILSESRGEWNTDVYSDFANLLATCTDVESADVPSAIQNLANDIAKNIEKERFKNMDIEEAMKWLKETNCSSRSMFQKFLTKHGHRCCKEFDVYSIAWGTDPKPLVKTLQAMVGGLSSHNSQKKIETSEEAIENLKTPLTRKTKWLLRYLLPLCRKAVGLRENSKSLLTKVFNAWRIAYRKLAKLMVLEGRLPEEDLAFFLTYEEIGQLIETRSSKLLSKAVRRKRVYPDLDKLIFPEIVKGIPVPIQTKIRGNSSSNKSSFEVKGIPVSRGVAKGPARVICDIKDAETIQSGDILITYSTDIGWSPYFPLLSGIVTELGGLVSHGAVVAREYGLPCLVGLHGATQMFHTGDLVTVDADRGILRKIYQNEKEKDISKY